jgi:dethiobiotin synthetase
MKSAAKTSPPRFLFVTGTDTGVGKTTISCALLAAWHQRGHAVTAIKPIETGIHPGAKDCDAGRLAAAARQPLSQAAWLQLEPPIAPEAAARATDSTGFIDTAELVKVCRARASQLTLVEGAGGLLVPIARGYTMADLAQELDAAVLVVARTRLGTINHSLLTVAECRRRGLRLIGLVLNRCELAEGPEEKDNAALIESHGEVPVFGPFPYLPDADGKADTDAAAVAERHLPIERILHELTAATP